MARGEWPVNRRGLPARFFRSCPKGPRPVIALFTADSPRAGNDANMNLYRYLIIGNFALFQLLWFAAIFGAAAGLLAPVLLVLLMLFVLGPLFERPLAPDLRMACAGLLVGLAVEPLWIGAGLIEYRLQFHALLPPVWILALWMGFALSFNYSLAWLQGRRLLAAVFGGVGSVLSVLAGVRFGAAEAPAGLLPLALAYGALWAILVPMLAQLAQRFGKADRLKGMINGTPA